MYGAFLIAVSSRNAQRNRLWHGVNMTLIVGNVECIIILLSSTSPISFYPEIEKRALCPADGD